MANDVEITVTVRDLSASHFNQLNQRLNNARARATAAGTAFRGLEQRIDGATSALRTMNVLTGALTTNLAHLQAETRDLAQAMGQVATRTGRVSDGFVVLDAEARMLRHDMDQLGGSLDGVHGGLRDLGDGSRQARRDVSGLGGGLGDLDGHLSQVESNAGGAASALGSGGGGGGGLGGALGVAAAAALSALPAMGALVPMLAGLSVAAATVKLGFSGIGKAMTDQGKDSKKYKADLKAMSPQSRELTKSLVDLKKEFSGTGKAIQKAMLPGFTSALKAAKPEVKAVRGAMVDMAKVFGDAAKGVGKLMKDSGFQKDFSKTLKLGTGFIKDMTTSFGPFLKSLIHFGAVSEKSLKAFSGGIGDLLSKGVPGFFKNLEPGIAGASKLITGLFDAINLILPALGNLSGSLGKNLGPLFGAFLKNAGLLVAAFADGLTPALDALAPTANSAAGALNTMGKYIEPLAKGLGTALGGAVKLLTPVFKNLFDLASIALPIFVDLAGAIAGPLLSAFSEVAGMDSKTKTFGQGLKDFGNWVHDNKGTIDQAMRRAAVAILDLVITAVGAAPQIFHAFAGMVNGVMTVFGVFAQGAAAAFGWIPGIGGKIKSAASDFMTFRQGVQGSLDTAGKDIQAFHDSALPKLQGQKMKLDVSPYNAALGAAGKALSRMPAPKTAKLKADDSQWQSVVRQAGKALSGLPAKKTAKLTAKDAISAAAHAAQRAIDAITGKTVVVNYVGKKSGFAGGKLAHGGVVGAFADGGAVGSDGALALVGEQGPELVRLPIGGTVYPAGKSKQMMKDGAEPARAYAKGGTVTKAEASARSGAWGDLTVSHFGQKAGRTKSEFATALGSPDSLSSLVDSLNKWRGIIKAATSGATERGLLKSLDKAAAGLIKHEKALAKVNDALTKAKDKLSSLKDAASQLKDSIKSGIIGSANITGTASSGARVTTGTIIGQLTGKRDQAGAFADALKALKKKGLNSQSLSEIAAAGLEGGGLETATALMSSSKGDIKQINSLEKQIGKSATSAGSTTSNAVYGASIKMADALVSSLKKQQSALEKGMEKAAKTLEKAIERAFKHKASGGIIGAASGGARGGLTWVGEQGPELARLPYGSTVYPAGQSRRMAMAGGGGGGGVIQVNLILDGKVAARALIDPLKGEVNRISGGSVQKALGRGNG
jgi:hypothetical protein